MKKQWLVFVLLGAAACSPMVDNRGYVKRDGFKDRLVVGQTSRQEVLDQFGSPSSQSSFGTETWYYIHNRKETVGFLKPESVDQDVTRIAFDAQGMVASVESFSQSEARDVKMIRRETPTEGHSLGFIEQALGNIGRFNKAGGDTVAPGRKPNPGGY